MAFLAHDFTSNLFSDLGLHWLEARDKSTHRKMRLYYYPPDTNSMLGLG